MKKTNHYVQWQQLKQLHKTTYVGSYKPLVSRVGLCVSTELWTLLAEPSLAETSTRSLKLSRPKQTQPDERAWHKGLHENKMLAYWIVPLSEVERVRFICIFPTFAFLFGHVCACMRHAGVCFWLAAPLARCVSSVIPCPWATDQSSRADSLPAGAGLIKEAQTDPGFVIKTRIHSD